MTIRHSKCERLMKKKLMLSTTKLNRLQEFEKCISLIMDKMYIKEGLVYNENSEVVRLARKHWRGVGKATTMFVLVVRGLFIHL